MSSIPTPQTFSQRPPFRGGPPVQTTFDGGFSGGGDKDPNLEIYLESAERLLKTVDRIPVPGLPLMKRLLLQRRKWLEEELWARRSLSASSLPPVRGFELESYFEPSDNVEGRFVRIVDRIDDAILKIDVKMKLQNCPFPLSEL